jgi:hypothetical protein
MSELFNLRKRFARQARFVTIFPSGIKVAWNPLSVGDFVKYTREVDTQEELLEDEIFLKCVENEYYKKDIDNLDAGIIESVVVGILSASCPDMVEDMQAAMEAARYQFCSNIIDQNVIIICRAFPGYTPDDLYRLNFRDFMRRLAMAERKLLDNGVLKEPISFYNAQEEKKTLEVPQSIEESKPRIDLKKQFEQQHRVPQKTQPKMTVITKDELMSPAMAIDRQDPGASDRIMMEKKRSDMLAETLRLYPDYVGKKITPADIKTPEQQVEEIKKHMDENTKLANQITQTFARKQAVENKRIEKLFQKGLKKQKRK